MNIEEIFPGGEWKNDNEYVITCPYCPDGDHPTHGHCWINPSKEQWSFHCFRCGEGGSLERLLKEHGHGAKPEPKKGIVEKKRLPIVDFSQFKKVTGTEGTLDRLAFTYLTAEKPKGRGLTKEEIELYDIRYASHGKFYGRVLIPIYDQERVVNFIGRSFIHFVTPPYRFPSYGETILTSSEALFGYDRIVRAYCPKAVVITEGVFDAMAVRRIGFGWSVAVLSKVLSKGQLFKLLKLPVCMYYVMLDADAHKDAILVARQLSAYGRKVRVALLEKGDPASVLGEELVDTLYKAKLYSFDLQMEVMLND